MYDISHLHFCLCTMKSFSGMSGKFSHIDVASGVDVQKLNIIAEKVDTIEETLKDKIEIDLKLKELDERIKLLTLQV